MASLHKTLSLTQGVCLLLTSLLGTGAFVVPALAASIAEEQSLYGWLLMFILILPIALVFGYLGARYPHQGGTAHLLSLAFNKRLERLCGWLFISLIPVGLPAALAIAVGYLASFFNLDVDYHILLSLILIVALVLLNLSGVSNAAFVQTLIAIGVLVSICVLVFFSNLPLTAAIPPDINWQAWPKTVSTVAVIFWCFLGIEAMLHMGAEYKNPRRDFPLTIAIALILSACFYYACAVIVVHYNAYGNAQTDNISIAIVAREVFGVYGVKLISFIAFAAAFASINLYTMSFSRMILSMAQRGQLPAIFAQINVKGVPRNSILLIGFTMLVSLGIANLTNIDLSTLIKYADGVFALIYVFAMASAVMLLKRLRLLAVIAMLSATGLFMTVGSQLSYVGIAFLVFYIIDSIQQKTIFRRNRANDSSA